MKQSTKEYRARRRWFLSMVGQRLYRTKSSCTCSGCKSAYISGINIVDSEVALALFDVESALGMKYYATEKERDEAELNDNLKIE